MSKGARRIGALIDHSAMTAVWRNRGPKIVPSQGVQRNATLTNFARCIHNQKGENSIQLAKKNSTQLSVLCAVENSRQLVVKKA